MTSKKITKPGPIQIRTQMEGDKTRNKTGYTAPLWRRGGPNQDTPAGGLYILVTRNGHFMVGEVRYEQNTSGRVVLMMTVVGGTPQERVYENVELDDLKVPHGGDVRHDIVRHYGPVSLPLEMRQTNNARPGVHASSNGEDV